MYDISTIQSAFLSLIGWRNSHDADMPRLRSTLTGSTSGLFYNDAHPLASIENIDASAPNYDGMTNSDWLIGSTYAIGNVARYDGIVYISLVDNNIGQNPKTMTASWTALLNNHIEQLTKTSVVNMVERFINERQIHNANKALLDDVRLFDGEGRQTSLIIAQSRFVGFEIKVRNYLGLVASIRRISGQFSQAQNPLKIYLFHTSQNTAIATFDVITTAVGSAQWVTPVGFDMNFCKYSKHDSGGAFYVGYFENNLTGQAINRDVDLIAEPCTTCFKDAYNRYSWELRNRYISVTPIYFANQYLNGTSLPDADGISYVSNTNWGLNLALTSHCDLTDFFVDNKAIFSRVLWKQVAIDVIKGIAFSSRVDGLTNDLKQDAYAELKGDPQKAYRNGIDYELDKEYKAINFAIEDLNSPCMNKKGNTGLKISAI